jgi:Zn-dependent M28 family amino/carboxypeptidase
LKESIVDNRNTSSVVCLISKQKIEKWLDEITAFHTRHTKSKSINQVAEWIKNELINLGYKNVYFHNYTEKGYSLKNVICHKQGRTNRLIIVCAHYDCRTEELNNVKVRSPGADDNASGMSSILELARVLAPIELEDCIQFVFFSGEEQGQWGSKNYARYIKEKSINLHRLVNLDMVGCPPKNGKQLVIERHKGNVVSTNEEDSEAFARVIERMMASHTDLHILNGPTTMSDCVPFEALGYKVAGLYDGADVDSGYHTVRDLKSNLSIDYIASVTKIVLATLLHETRFDFGRGLVTAPGL